jgi:hypothetical protein
VEFFEDLRVLKSLQLNQVSKGKAIIATPDATTNGTLCEEMPGDLPIISILGLT